MAIRFLTERQPPNEYLRPVVPKEYLQPIPMDCVRPLPGRTIQITISVHDEQLYPMLFEAMRSLKPIPVTVFGHVWLVQTAICSEHGEVTFSLIDMGPIPAPVPFPAPIPPEPLPPLTPVQRALRAPQHQPTGPWTR